MSTRWSNPREKRAPPEEVTAPIGAAQAEDRPDSGISTTLKSPPGAAQLMHVDALEGCLSEAAILAFVQGALESGERVQVHAHLDGCTLCQLSIAEAAQALDTTEHTVHKHVTTFQPGAILADRYRVQRFVQRGGMGEVYDCYDRKLQERVALKTVVATASDDPRAVRRLMAEVQLARRISHGNVCRIYDLGCHELDGEGPVHFLTMEFVEGTTLGDELRNGPFAIDRAVAISREILHGLEAAHAAGIVHRDLKTHNIMLRRRWGAGPSAVIMDFGLARALYPDPTRLTTGRNEALVGSLPYMAPEQIEGNALGVTTDIYALGVILFEMLTGQLPFNGANVAAAALKRLRERPLAPSALRPRIPPALDRIVLRCLARDPKERYPCAAAVAVALDNFEQQSLTQFRRRASRTRWLALVAGGSLLGDSALYAALDSAELRSPSSAETPSVSKASLMPQPAVDRPAAEVPPPSRTPADDSPNPPKEPRSLSTLQPIEPLRTRSAQKQRVPPKARSVPSSLPARSSYESMPNTPVTSPSDSEPPAPAASSTPVVRPSRPLELERLEIPR